MRFAPAPQRVAATRARRTRPREPSTRVVAAIRPLTVTASSLPSARPLTVPVMRRGSTAARPGARPRRRPGRRAANSGRHAAAREPAAHQLAAAGPSEQVVAGRAEQRLLVAQALRPLRRNVPNVVVVPSSQLSGTSTRSPGSAPRVAEPARRRPRSDSRRPSSRAIVGSTSIVRTAPPSTTAVALPGRLDEERHVRDVVDVGGRRPRRRSPDAEAHAVVGGDHDQRAVVQPGRLEAVEQAPEQPVGELGLHEVALEGLVGEPLRPDPAALDRAPAWSARSPV